MIQRIESFLSNEIFMISVMSRTNTRPNHTCVVYVSTIVLCTFDLSVTDNNFAKYDGFQLRPLLFGALFMGSLDSKSSRS